MRRCCSFVVALVVVAPAVGVAADLPVLLAAKRADPSVSWQAKSVVYGDFTCAGGKESALLGTSKKHIVVAVFGSAPSKPVDILRFSARARNPASAELTVEDLDFKPEEFEREVGAIPEGLVPSKTCLGLNLSDKMVDSAHIYWHRGRGRFESWSR